ncbi:hypothetical protein HK405_011808, partial [Cladochytrium tenue]
MYNRPRRAVLALALSVAFFLLFATSSTASASTTVSLLSSPSLAPSAGHPVMLRAAAAAAAAPTVVVVGGGLAGLAAASEAAARGAAVVLLDKCPRLGGNSAKASSGMNAAGSRAQAAQGVADAPEHLLHDTLASGGGLSDPQLAEALAHASPGAAAWLESLGLDLAVLSRCGGHS